MFHIYQIKNLNNDKIYVGMTQNTHKRWLKHDHDMRFFNHHNEQLQKDYNNRDNFSFKVLISFNEKREALDFERLYTETLKEMSYNLLEHNNPKGSLGHKHTKEALAKISARSKGTNNPAYDDDNYVLINVETKEIKALTKLQWRNYLSLKTGSSLYTLCSDKKQKKRKFGVGKWKRTFCHLYEKEDEKAQFILDSLI